VALYFALKGLYNSAQWQRLELNMNVPISPFASLLSADLQREMTVVILIPKALPLG